MKTTFTKQLLLIRKISILSVALFLSSSILAANRYWVGATSGTPSWNSTTNWSTTSGGASGASVPTASDAAIFDGENVSNPSTSSAAYTVDVAGATIVGQTLQINANVTVTLSGTATSITFTGATNGLVLLGFLNDGGNTITLGGNIANTYTVGSMSAVTASGSNYIVTLTSVLGLKVGQFVSGTNIPALAAGVTSYISAIDRINSKVTLTTTGSFGSTPSGTLTVGILTGSTTTNAGSSTGATSISLTSTAGIVQGSNILGTNINPTNGPSVVNGTISGSSVPVFPAVLSTGPTNGALVIYYTGAVHSGTGKIVMTGGTISPIASKTIGANNIYCPTYRNIEIGDGTATQSAISQAGGTFRITGTFKINSNSIFLGPGQAIQMYDPINNVASSLNLTANSYLSTLNKSNGFATNNASTFSVNSSFMFPGGSILANQITMDPASTYCDSITTAAQNSFIPGPLTYGNLVIANLNTTYTGTIQFQSSVTSTIKGTFTIRGSGSCNKATTLGNATGLILAPTANLVLTTASDSLNLNFKNLLLQSDATGTASIAAMPTTNMLENATNVTVQRYIPSDNRKKYVLVSSPVTSTINAGWQEGLLTSNSLPTAVTAGYGTHITRSAGAGNGFDTTSASSASIFTYDDTKTVGTKWTSLTSTTTAASLAPGTGYLMFVRGDRSENRPATGNSSNTILRGTGTVGQGTISPALLTGADKYTLIANPYPSAIDWNSVNITKTNLTGSFTVYDSNLGVFVSSNGTTKTPNSGNQQAQYIQSGQAFFVQNSASGNGAITFTESAKTTAATTTSGTTVFGETSPVQQLNINAYRVDNNQFADGAVAMFGTQYKATIDNNDIAKFTNFNETFGLRRSNTILGLEARPLVSSADTLYVNMGNFGKRDYNLLIDGSNFTEATATLEDKYTATKQAIDLSGTTTYKFTVNADVASSSNDRFIITLGSTAKQTAIDATANNSLFVKLSPNPVANQLQVSFKTATANQTTINIVNSLGQVVKTVNAGKVDNGNINIPVTNLSTGIYTVQLLSGDKQISSQKLVKE